MAARLGPHPTSTPSPPGAGHGAHMEGLQRHPPTRQCSLHGGRAATDVVESTHGLLLELPHDKVLSVNGAWAQMKNDLYAAQRQMEITMCLNTGLWRAHDASHAAGFWPALQEDMTSKRVARPSPAAGTSGEGALAAIIEKVARATVEVVREGLHGGSHRRGAGSVGGGNGRRNGPTGKGSCGKGGHGHPSSGGYGGHRGHSQAGSYGADSSSSLEERGKGRCPPRGHGRE